VALVLAIAAGASGETDPWLDRALRGASRALQAGDVEHALELAQRAAQHAPDHPAVQHLIGLAALRLQRWPLARAAFDSALTSGIDSTEALRGRGYAAERMGDPAAAERDFRRALTLAPRDPATLSLLAGLLLDLDRGAEATSLADRLIEMDPDRASHWTLAGRLAVGLGDLAAAERDFRRALILEPGDREARYALAQLLTRTGRVDEAERELRLLPAPAVTEEQRPN
jgi:tetratricopeptide (TPR) repeat protein